MRSRSGLIATLLVFAIAVTSVAHPPCCCDTAAAKGQSCSTADADLPPCCRVEAELPPCCQTESADGAGPEDCDCDGCPSKRPAPPQLQTEAPKSPSDVEAPSWFVGRRPTSENTAVSTRHSIECVAVAPPPDRQAMLCVWTI